MQHSPASSNAHSAGCTVFGWLSRKNTLPVRVSQNGSQVLRYEPVRNWMVLNGSQHWDPPNRCFPPVCAPIFGAPPKTLLFVTPKNHMSHSENLQSLPMSYHFGCAKAYAMLTRVGVFPYAKQIEETLTRSPYAGLTQARVSLTPNM